MNLLEYVLISDPLAAWRTKGIGADVLSFLVAGMIDTSEPVSTRKRRPLVLSCNLRRRLEKVLPTFADSGEQKSSFLVPDTDTAACTVELADQMSGDTSTSRLLIWMLIGCDGGLCCCF